MNDNVPNVVNINQTKIASFGEIVIFKRDNKYERTRCKHLKVIIDDELGTVECEDCKEKLNPIRWIVDHHEKLQKWQESINRRLARAKAIEEKFKAKGKFFCVSCQHTNTIDFSKLISNKAIERNMQVLESEE